MTDRDPAFLWETEALRSAAQRMIEAEIDTDNAADDSGRWVTLREASRATGIPVETLRKWARRSTIPTYLTPTNRGTSLRMVDLDGVTARAQELGRKTVAPAESSPAAAPSPSPAGTEEPPPPGTMIVPIDAWNKMLNQLGNLHEAGQQLAVARERAAKAETEARFLRERLAELRRQEDPHPTPDPPAPVDPTPVDPASVTPPPEKVWHYLVRRVRKRRQG